MTISSVTRSYYFNPLTQIFSFNPPERWSVHVTLTVPNELRERGLVLVIQRLGNYMALLRVEEASSVTANNYCTDFTLHSLTCRQERWQFCKKHLTEQEIKECDQMKKSLNPLLLNGVHFKMLASEISRGDDELMRGILMRVRIAMQQTESNHNA